MKLNWKKIKNYLPSKNFSIIAGISIVVISLFVGAFFVFGRSTTFVSKKAKLALENKTVADLVVQDTDKDSIPDWEEALWGTDKNKKKTFNDTPDVVYIENKKKELKLESTVDENNATETDKFAQEFFAAYAALKANGADQNLINNFSSSLGQQIVTPKLIDKYTEKDIHLALTDSSEEKDRYYNEARSTFEDYEAEGLGSELEILSNAIITYDSKGVASVEDLDLIGDYYEQAAEKIMALSVPASLTDIHLKIANSANNLGISVHNMTKVVLDPIVGLSGISAYQEYSDNLKNAVADLETTLEQ